MCIIDRRVRKIRNRRLQYLLPRATELNPPLKASQKNIRYHLQ